MSAPSLAIKVWLEAGEWRWRMNPALRAWAAPQGLTTQHWQSFVVLLMTHCANGQTPADQRVNLVGTPMRAVFHALSDVWLVWLVEIPAAADIDEVGAAVAVTVAGVSAQPEATSADRNSSAQQGAQHLITGKLAQAMNLASIAVWRIDVATQHVEFNDFGYRLNRVKPRVGGLPLKLVRATMHPDDRLAVENASATAMDCDGVIDLETRHLNADGSYRTILTRRVAERDSQGRAVALAGISIDQTARIAEREKNHALTRNIELVTDAAGIGVWSVDVASGQVEWNRQMFLMYDLPETAQAPSVAQWMGECLHPEDRSRVDKERSKALELGIDFETEFRIARPTGGWRHVVCRSRREKRAGREVAHGIHIDVTQRRVTEGRLHLLEQRALLANQAVGLGTWERDLVSDESQWDAQMYALRGLAATDPRSPNELRRICIHPDDLPEMLARFSSGFTCGEASDFEFEFRVLWPDGSVHWLNTRGLVLHDDAGHPLRALGVNWDITARKLAEQTWRDKQAAEQASRTKSEFLSSMSHELRTPLNAVLGFSQLLLMDSVETLAPEQARRVGHIQTAGQHLLALIDDVLDLAAIEAGALPLKIEPVAMHAVLSDVIQWTQPQARARHITLNTEFGPAWVQGDARRVRQIVGNLLSNAVKYNRSPGQVWVVMRSLERAAQRVGETPLAGWELSVRDSGRGLTAAQMAQVFEPFNRLGMEHEGIEGTGIGLTIVRDLVHRMGGHIEVHSEPGQGCEFRVWWPAAQEPPQAAPADLQAGAVATSAQTFSLLYIEDNPVNMLLIQELLVQRPHIRLLCAPDGEAGVVMALANTPDLVLVDMELPDFDGFEVLLRLKAIQNPTTTQTPQRFIALSANAMPSDVNSALAAGFDDYWTKPIDMKKVLEKLDTMRIR
jgi:signal transduction histidine kinase/ActR/RegA family two-component response regulator